jgi:hypothetical protein
MRNHLGLLLLAALILSACGPSPSPGQNAGAAPSTPFLAPTLAPPSPTGAQAGSTQPAAPTACTNALTFLSDVTLPDGANVPPSASLDKRWQVKNSGTCNWDEHYRFQRISGPAMGAADIQSLYPARGGAQATLRLNFVAPAGPGAYRSEWQAIDPQGNPFGDPVFLDIVVQ